MRVYHINVTARFSTGTIVKNIHNALKKRGDDSRLAYGHGGDCEKDFYQIANIWTLRLDAKWTQLTGYEGNFARLSTKKLIKDIRRFAPDIIHLHNIHGHYLHLPTLFQGLQQLDKPVVFTLHDCWMFTGGCYHFYSNACMKWRETCKGCKYPRKFFLNKLYSRTEQEFEMKKKLFGAVKELTITTVSEWLQSVAEQSFLKNREIHVVPNGIDTNIFGPKKVDELRQKLQCQGKIVLLGVASTWSERKGLSKWFHLAEELESHYQIILVGLSEKQKRILPQNIIGLGRAKEIEELVELYNLADIYINLSAEETFGLPTAEAMACGTPVIVLNATANPELVTEQVGRIAEDDSVESLKKCIDEIKNVGKRSMSEACILHARNKYSHESMTKGYLCIYDEIFGRRKIR